MAIVAQELQRVFIYETEGQKIELADPNPAMPVSEVRDLYTVSYAELLNSTIVQKGVENDRLVYEFKAVAGTKG